VTALPSIRPSESGDDLRSRTAPGSVPESPGPLVLAGFECSLSTTSLDRLEEVGSALDGSWLAQAAVRVGGTLEAAPIRTCCRRELLVVAESATDAERWLEILPGGPGLWQARRGREAVRHLFRVAAGLESIARGEREVRQQIGGAGGNIWSRHRERLLRDLLADAVTAAASTAPYVPPSRSIAAIAATRALELCGRPFPRVVVLGAGQVGRQVTELLAPSAKVTLLFRQRPPDERFLQLWGVRAARAEELAAEVGLADVVITAAKSGVRCVSPDDLPRDRPIVLVDLGVPRNIDPEVRTLPNVRLLDLEELGRSPRPEVGPSLERAVEAHADRTFSRFEVSALEPWIAELRRAAEAIRRSELESGRPHFGRLTKDQEAAVDRLTRRLVDRLLRSPTARLRAVPPGEEGDRLRRFALALLASEPRRS